MRPYINLFILIMLAALLSVGFATEAAAAAGGGDSVTVPGGSGDAGVPSFPYDAEITGDDVLVRSGAGTNYYRCGKLNKGDRVKVVGKLFSWSRIVPPAGSFSWISEQYVKIDPDNARVGTVTGDSVRVYAGSNYVKPLYSTYLQGKLNKGNKVKLLGEQLDGYYKIAVPPLPNAFLWVSSNFIKHVPTPAPVETPPTPNVTPTVEPTVEANEPPAVVAPPVAPLSRLEQYRALKEKVAAERAKPTGQQDYASMKKALLAIANDKEAGNAARFSQFVLRQIEGYELALAVVKQVALQNEQLEKVRAGIDRARVARLAEVEDQGRFAVSGKLQTFTSYGPGHYRIVDDAGNMVCYILPSEGTGQTDLSGLVGKKVGVAGTIKPHLPTKGAVVEFTEVAEIK